ncbi:MAG: hypothetical protein E6G27_16355 [Actinobacteria bacterium]|nr:MAG: hypothetical protein E6G27_16355 [Actinomycetota bacterium]
MTREEGTDRTDRTDRMAEALAHLQLAALELIEAARAALDVAEDLVREPATALLVAGMVGEAVRAGRVTTDRRSPVEHVRVAHPGTETKPRGGDAPAEAPRAGGSPGEPG